MRMRDVVDVVTSDPPPLRYGVDEIVASGQRAQRRRRLVRAVSGAATVVVALGAAVAVAVPALSGGPAEKAAPAAAPPAAVPPAAVPPAAVPPAAVTTPVGPFMFTFGAYKVGRLSVAAPIAVSTAYQLAPVYADDLTSNDRPVDPSTETTRDKRDAVPDPGLSAYLTVYRPGAYDPSKLVNAQPVAGGGRPGLSVASTEGNWAMTRTFAWQYADGAWAVISSRSDDANHPSVDELSRLAAGLRTDARTPAKVPVRLGYVPAGYGLTEVGVKATTGLNGLASARAGDFGGLLFSKPALPTTGLTGPFTGADGGNPAGSFVIFIVPAANANQTPTPGVTCLTGFCNRWFAGVNVQVSSEGLLPNEEMKRILEGVTLADVRNESTWTEATAAV